MQLCAIDFRSISRETAGLKFAAQGIGREDHELATRFIANGHLTAATIVHRRPSFLVSNVEACLQKAVAFGYRRIPIQIAARKHFAGSAQKSQKCDPPCAYLFHRF